MMPTRTSPRRPARRPVSRSARNPGALWFTYLSAPKIGRITTGGTVTEFPAGGLTPFFITPGPTGSDRMYVSFAATSAIEQSEKLTPREFLRREGRPPFVGWEPGRGVEGDVHEE